MSYIDTTRTDLTKIAVSGSLGQVATMLTNAYYSAICAAGKASGKRYWEVKIRVGTSNAYAGIGDATFVSSLRPGYGTSPLSRSVLPTLTRYYQAQAQICAPTGNPSAWSSRFNTVDGVAAFALDLDTGEIWAGAAKSGDTVISWGACGASDSDPATGTSPLATDTSMIGVPMYPCAHMYYAGNEYEFHLAADEMEFPIPTGFQAWLDDGSISLTSSIFAGSSSSAISVQMQRAFLASIMSQSSTSTPSALVGAILNLQAALVVYSATGVVPVTLARNIVANIAAQSAAPSITATLQGLFSLVANITGTAVTPSIGCTIARLLAAAISATASTSQLSASIERALLADITAVGVTPSNVAASLSNLRQLLGHISAQTVTPSTIATVRRELSSAIAALVSTGGISASAGRELLAAINVASITPNTVLAYLSGLGIVFDTTFASQTPMRSFRSKTTQRESQSRTAIQSIRSV
ncbi:MAG: hypothetical protein RBS34_00575 [Desulfofustis sp.]|jgi:hypothetical protein|nr:hypothetical protein [Desulfofustis sp.]